MDESMRFPGAMPFAPEPTSSYWLGIPGLASKSSISLLSRNPAFDTMTPLPNQEFSVVVSATTLPSASTIERCVVWFPSGIGPGMFVRSVSIPMPPELHGAPARPVQRTGRRAGSRRSASPGRSTAACRPAMWRRQEPLEGHAHEVRISEVGVEVGEGARHDLARQVHAVDRERLDGAQVVVLEHAEHFEERDASGTRRRRHEHLEITVPAA
jgi:hypothetical protein